MSNLTPAALVVKYNDPATGLFRDNSTLLINEATFRAFVQDVAESVMFGTSTAPITDLTRAEALAAVTAETLVALGCYRCNRVDATKYVRMWAASTRAFGPFAIQEEYNAETARYTYTAGTYVLATDDFEPIAGVPTWGSILGDISAQLDLLQRMAVMINQRFIDAAVGDPNNQAGDEQRTVIKYYRGYGDPPFRLGFKWQNSDGTPAALLQVSYDAGATWSTVGDTTSLVGWINALEDWVDELDERLSAAEAQLTTQEAAIENLQDRAEAIEEVLGQTTLLRLDNSDFESALGADARAVAPAAAMSGPRSVVLPAATNVPARERIVIIDDVHVLAVGNGLTVKVPTGTKLNGVTNGTVVLESSGQILTFFSGGANGWFYRTADLTSGASIPSQTGNGGKILATDGTTPSWSTPAARVFYITAAAVSVGTTSAETQLAALTISAALMAGAKAMRLVQVWTYTASANAKNLISRFGPDTSTPANNSQISNFVSSSTTAGAPSAKDFMFRTGNKLACPPLLSLGAEKISTTAFEVSSIDTTAAQAISIAGKKAASGTSETLTLEYAYLIIYY